MDDKVDDTRPRKPLRRRLALALALALLAAPASAQVVGGGLPSVGGGVLPGGLPSPVPQVRLPDPKQTVGGLLDQGASAATLAEGLIAETRGAWADRLLRQHPRLIEADEAGEPVVRGQVLAIAPDAAALARARQAGFGVGRPTTYRGLGLSTVVLTPPRGVSATEAVRRLRALDPEGEYEFNHLYQQAGAAAGSAAAPAAAVGGGSARGVRMGLVDGSAAPHPALARAKLVQRAFGPGGARATAHATAVASLMAGAQGRFHGAAPGATLYVADVYGPTPAGGSAEAIVRGLSWLSENRTPVINISLVGPPNRLLGAAVQALAERGHVLVAAVGNDGPAAAPLYPAAYPGVVAVTGVDARRRVLPEAGRGAHVDFAAPGADLAAGALDGGYVSVRGTSFAAPIAAGALARRIARPDPAAARAAVDALGREAADLGAAGADPVYGRGLVGFEFRTDPEAVGARRLAVRGP